MSIAVEGLSFAYGSHQVLRDVTFSIGKGRLAALLGPNGVGKSTLFQCMLGLRRQQAGTIAIGGQPTAGLSARALSRLVAYIPQTHAPAFAYRVLDMVLMGATAQVGALTAPGRPQREAALATLARLGIEGLAGRDFTRISGGERQLVLIARALLQDTRVLLMDEPTANLDYGNQLRVLQHIRSLAGEGYTILLSTHNPEQASLFAHDILAMQNGRIIAQGAPQDTVTAELIEALYGIPTNMYTLRDGQMRVFLPKNKEVSP